MNRKLPYTYFIFSIVAFFFCFILPTTAKAEETGSFTYKVIPPENQRSNVGYFDLQMTPGQKQTVQIELNNTTSDKPVTVEVKRNAVKTNSNGVLEYGSNTFEKDPSAKIDFDEIVSVPESITLNGGETKNIDIQIDMPEQSFDGIVSGGIQLQQAETEKQQKEQTSKSGVTNKYAFLIGVLLTETDVTIAPEITFNNIHPGLSNYRNAIFVNMSNTEMTFMSGMDIEFDVRKKGSDAILYDTKKTDMKMAPTSMIDFPLLLNGDEMKVGSYTGHVLVTSGDKRWEWEEDFEITQKDADKYNKQDVSLVQEQGLNWQLILLIVLSVVGVVLLIVLILYFVNKKKKKNKKKSNTKKKKRE